jgi:hypothetical protein
METNKKLQHFLGENMAWENTEMEAPGLSAMSAAREAVMARKKMAEERKPFISLLLSVLNFDLKFYHLGISVLLIMVGTFYITESHYDVTGNSGFSGNAYNTLSIKSPTAVSVNSSTMLTSIPTLRN